MKSVGASGAGDAIQIALLRAADPVRRVALARSLTQIVVQLSRRAIADTHPSDAPRQNELRWLAMTYGPELAAAVARSLESRRDANSA